MLFYRPGVQPFRVSWYGAQFLRLCRFLAVTPLCVANALAVEPLSIHLGVATCAGSNCHGASSPQDGSIVLQNEFLTWHRRDKHAKAYQVLHDEAAQRIARNLGISNAHEAATCLSCHTDFVAPSARGRRFQISDGVGCEACHGGAEKWLGTHVSGKASHADNLALGMYPTSSPRHRAKLCLGCHLGDADHEMTHRIMGAGHPRLGFELDTFTEIQPAHFIRDEDYQKRKPTPRHALIWATGQTTVARNLLEAVRRGAHRTDGLFPEFIYFNCHSCHRAISGPKSANAEVYGSAIGEVRLADASLVMVGALVDVLVPDAARRYHENVTRLHANVQSRGGDVNAVAKEMLDQIALVDGKLDSGIDDHAATQLIERILAAGADGAFFDYGRAEQAVMALDALRNDGIQSSIAEQLAPTIEALFQLLQDEASFTASAVVDILQAETPDQEH